MQEADTLDYNIGYFEPDTLRVAPQGAASIIDIEIIAIAQRLNGFR